MPIKVFVWEIKQTIEYSNPKLYVRTVSKNPAGGGYVAPAKGWRAIALIYKSQSVVR